jgi:hypothetical protein
MHTSSKPPFQLGQRWIVKVFQQVCVEYHA